MKATHHQADGLLYQGRLSATTATFESSLSSTSSRYASNVSSVTGSSGMLNMSSLCWKGFGWSESFAVEA